jgi:nucleoside-diphosphate-sugar epimerase
VRELLGRGERVRVLLRQERVPSALAGLEVEIYPGDILDPVSLASAVCGASLVYHLAARISLATGLDPETERVNLEGTQNVIAAIRGTGSARLVYASSIYALRKPPGDAPIDETQPFEPLQSRGVYDRSKAMASLAVQQAAAEGLDAVLVCPTAVTGPFDFHESEAGRAIRLYMRPGLKFYVDGAYDFIDVRDAARGFILAAEKGKCGETYILGGGRLTVWEMIETVWAAAGGWHASIKVPLWLACWVAELAPFYYQLAGAKPFFTRYSLDAVTSNSHVSHAKASRELGFHPRPARQAITDSVNWFRQMQTGGVPIPGPYPRAAA